MSKKGAYINIKSLTKAQRHAYHIQVAALRAEGLNAPTIARRLKLNRSPVQDWVKRLDDADGDIAVLEETKRGRKTDEYKALSPQQQKEIQKLILDKTPDQLKFNFALWTSQAVALLIRERYKVKMADRTVRRYLASWGYTPQRPVRRAYEQNPVAVQNWLSTGFLAIRKRAKKENAEINWLDESCVKACAHRPRGYAPKGKTPEFRPIANQGVKVNIIAAITNQGKMRFMLSDKAFNAQLFQTFMERLVSDAKRKVFLILDNLKVHHAKCLKPWLEKNKAKIELFYLPSYSPDLNPVELLNNDTKTAMNKGEPARCKGKLERKVEGHLLMRQRQPDVVKSFFEKESVAYAADTDEDDDVSD